ncbi:hypothetical protein V1478_018363, partial [Vespula squamosa]
ERAVGVLSNFVQERRRLSRNPFFGSPPATETAVPVFPCISPSVLLLNKLSRIVRNMLKRKPKMRTSSPSREEGRSTSSQLNWLYFEIIARPVGLRGASEILAKGESRFSPERSASVSSFERVDRTKKSYKKKEGSTLQEGGTNIFNYCEASRGKKRGRSEKRSANAT